jgi:hypothetical protein
LKINKKKLFVTYSLDYIISDEKNYVNIKWADLKLSTSVLVDLKATLQIVCSNQKYSHAENS